MIDRMEFVDRSFNEDDTGISWDGTISLYHGDVNKKENLDDIINVQIKGRKTNNKKLLEKYKFDINKTDLENYLKMDGTMFLLVLYKNIDSYKVYYVDLLPYNLKQILKQKPNNKNEIKVKLKEVKDHISFERILRNFSINKNEQKKISISIFEQSNLSINEKATEIKFYEWGNVKSLPFGLLGEEKYFYQYDENKNIVSINYVPIVAVEKKLNINVSNKKGEIFYSVIRHAMTQTSDNFIFGKAFTFNFREHKFDLKIQGTLKERLEQLNFINSIFEDKGFCINDEFLPFVITKEHKEQFSYINNIYKKINNFNEKHKITKDIDLDTWSSKDINDFLIWIDAIDNNKPLKIKEFDITSIGSIKINDIRFSILAEKRKDGGFDVYSLWNSRLNGKYEFKYVYDNFEIKTRNIYLVLNKYAYVSDDINIEEMKDFFDKYSLTDKEGILINFQILELLNAFDFTDHKELLKYAIYLLEKIENIHGMEDIAYINKAQTILRYDESLSDEMMEKLIDIRDKNDDATFKISANLLIGNKKEAVMQFAKLDENTKKMYLTYPIAYFLDN